ncbi:Mobile element protein [Candidatus Enterovibrio altilux]|uniref:Mobile element protein n=1 Tax=Candidatus Enterovibrio altilux TaxID=1927128 RepID=A0A291BA75_9GAMM|nr:Mobile element protein [Candidatus Enterovibrio luxaltus]
MNIVFKLVQLLLSCPHYLCICKWAKMVNVTFKTKKEPSCA